MNEISERPEVLLFFFFFCFWGGQGSVGMMQSNVVSLQSSLVEF